ncbi:hypothetical protein AB0D77_09725, partial [Streptomyces sp. NPDC048385]
MVAKKTAGDGEKKSTRVAATAPSEKTPGEKGSAGKEAAPRTPVGEAAGKQAVVKKADGANPEKPEKPEKPET